MPKLRSDMVAPIEIAILAALTRQRRGDELVAAVNAALNEPKEHTYRGVHVILCGMRRRALIDMCTPRHCDSPASVIVTRTKFGEAALRRACNWHAELAWMASAGLDAPAIRMHLPSGGYLESALPEADAADAYVEHDGKLVSVKALADRHIDRLKYVERIGREADADADAFDPRYPIEPVDAE